MKAMAIVVERFVVSFTILSQFCCFVSAATEKGGFEPNQPHRSFVFNFMYTAEKEKWQGGYHSELLFTWFIPTTPAANKQEYIRLIEHERQNGVKFIGYSYSSTTTEPPKPEGYYWQFPEGIIPPEAVKPSWIIRDANGQFAMWYKNKNRYFLDVGLREVQDAVLLRAIGNAKALGPNVLYLDNWYYKMWAPGDLNVTQWSEKNLSLLKRARELTNQNGLKLVVNTSSPPIYWSEFAPYLDGIAYEMPAHSDRMRRSKLYEEELNTYEKVLAMGKSVFLYTGQMMHDGKPWDEDGRKAAATAMLVMPPDQPYWGGIYVCPPRYEVWPVGGWPMWPQQLGRPLGPRQWEGDTVTRKFERGSVSVTTGKAQEFKVIIQY